MDGVPRTRPSSAPGRCRRSASSASCSPSASSCRWRCWRTGRSAVSPAPATCWGAARTRVRWSSPTINTALLGIGAAVVAVALVLPVAYLTTRYRSRVGGVANALVVAGFALPGIVVALSLVLWTLRSPLLDRLYQTLPLLIFAYVVHFGAQAMRSSQVAVDAVPRRVEDAARALGAGRWRRFRTIELPIMMPGLAAGGGLVLLSVDEGAPGDAPARADRRRDARAADLERDREGFFAQAGIAALVLVALSAVLTWFLTIRRMEALHS